jgi:hypothetical protein
VAVAAVHRERVTFGDTVVDLAAVSPELQALRVFGGGQVASARSNGTTRSGRKARRSGAAGVGDNQFID